MCLLILFFFHLMLFIFQMFTLIWDSWTLNRQTRISSKIVYSNKMCTNVFELTLYCFSLPFFSFSPPCSCFDRFNFIFIFISVDYVSLCCFAYQLNCFLSLYLFLFCKCVSRHKDLLNYNLKYEISQWTHFVQFRNSETRNMDGTHASMLFDTLICDLRISLYREYRGINPHICS